LTRNAFDGLGEATALTDPVSNRSVFLHDERGQLIKETDPFGKAIIRAYDDAGRLTSITDRKGRVREFSYFNDNRLQQEIWRDTAQGPAVNTIAYTYDADGRVLTASDNDGTYTMTYDELGRLATQQDPWGITLTYTYDAADRVTQITDTKGGTRTYEYDNANRNTVRKFSATGQENRLDLVYNNRNEVTEIKRYNDLAATQLRGSTVYAYDDAGRVTSITHKDGSGATIDSYSYQYDNADRVTQESSTLGPTRNYTYDADGQLLGDGASTFSYDKNGNRTMTGYQTGTGNRLTTDGTWDYSYDDEGNLIQKSETVNNETWTYGYDQANRLLWAEKRDLMGILQMRADYKYDVFGNRIQKAVDADGDGPQTTVIIKFAYEGPNAWADLDSAGSLTTRRLYLEAVDSVFAKVGSSGNEDWYLTDRLGSVRDIANSSGSIINHLDYGAFGKVTNETQPSNGDRYAFTARERDTETGLNYYRNRMQDSDTGRFTGEDQARWSAGDGNLFRYVGNNPINLTDPSGLHAWTAPRATIYTYHDLSHGEPEFPPMPPTIGGPPPMSPPLEPPFWDQLGPRPPAPPDPREARLEELERRIREREEEEHRRARSTPVLTPNLEGMPRFDREFLIYHVQRYGTLPDPPGVLHDNFGPGGYFYDAFLGNQGQGAGRRPSGVRGPQFRLGTGGTYVLVHPGTGNVMRVGRTRDLDQRRGQHERHPILGDFRFRIDRQTDDYDQQRGREQIIHDLYNPPYDLINPISPRNPNRQRYLDAGREIE
jgi:RHS repeat-associated protein